MSGECMDGDDSVTPTPTQSSQISSHSSDPPPNSSATSSPPFKPSHTPPSSSSREDCWTPEATFTLIEAWGQRYLILNRGNLRRNHWQDVAAAVNSQHHSKSTKLPRTDIQCKNRIDTVKKKYKIEKSRVSNSAGRYLSPWPFFSLLDSFIGDSFKSSPAVLSTRRKVPPPLPPPPSSFIGDSFKPSTAIVSTRRKVPPALPPPPSLVPVGPRSKRPITRPAHIWVNEAVSKRRFSAVERDSEEELESCEHDSRGEWPMKGCSTIAEAITKCGEIYKRVEEEKLRQMIELEKQRMLFTRDLEIQRMKFIAESQVELERVKSRRGFDKRSTYRR